MEKYLKHLNYEVHHDGVLSHQGTVPNILSLSGIERQFNLGGVWLWHTCPQSVCLKLYNDVRSAELYSDKTADAWLTYCEENNIYISNPHLGRIV